ncbi:calcium-binding protein [Arthrobacter crusticola]|uniref:Calcium-binding protein n=1 Tax=Arthrobacter crusticola TaxID=2547960 RepID=A0A4R5TUV2_9MICC|nr:calcium-binding protein [Arthrobacter crusticola]TDK24840.1 calcium-binding protein [Arthrobacter crusticola]
MNSTSTSYPAVPDNTVPAGGNSHRRTFRRRVVGALATGALTGPALLLGAVPAQAAATGVYIANGILEVRAGAATENRITVERVPYGMSWRYVVRDTGATVTIGNGCIKIDANTARCNYSGVSSVAVRTLDLPDRINSNVTVGTWVSAGDGNDYVDLHSAHDTAYGGPGNDKIFGWGGKDRLYGEAGNDIIHGHAHDDTVDGGRGTDEIYGDEGADMLWGEEANTLQAGSGGDLMRGGAGNDRMRGMYGSDRMYGEAGDDTVQGGYDRDRVIGGAGSDDLGGGNGNDWLYGRDDRAGNDIVRGDSGSDYCEADPGDTKQNCET